MPIGLEPFLFRDRSTTASSTMASTSTTMRAMRAQGVLPDAGLDVGEVVVVVFGTVVVLVRTGWVEVVVDGTVDVVTGTVVVVTGGDVVVVDRHGGRGRPARTCRRDRGGGSGTRRARHREEHSERPPR